MNSLDSLTHQVQYHRRRSYTHGAPGHQLLRTSLSVAHWSRYQKIASTTAQSCSSFRRLDTSVHHDLSYTTRRYFTAWAAV